MKSRPFPKFSARQPRAGFSTVALCASLLSAGPLLAGDLLVWNVNGLLGVNGSAAPNPIALGISGTALIGGGGDGNSGSPANTWNRSYTVQPDFATAMSQGNFVSFATTVDASFTASIDGFSGLNLARTSKGPDRAGMFYSADGGVTFTQTGTIYVVGTALGSAASAFGSDFAVTPLQVVGPATIQWRIVFYNVSTIDTNRVGIGNASANDFSITGSTSSASVKDLLWNGTDGDNWNYAKVNWLDAGNAYAPSKFTANDKATIEAAGSIVVDGGGIDVASLKVQNLSGTVTLAGGSLYGISLAKTEDGTLRLEAPNTFSGGSTLSGGITQIADATALGNQAITLSSATLSVDSNIAYLANPLILGAGGGTIDNTDGLTVTNVGNAIANNPLMKTGAGDLNLSQGLGVNNSGPVNLNIDAGSVTLSGTQEIDLGSNVFLNGNLNLAGPRLVFHKSEVTGSGTNSLVVQNSGAIIESRFNAGTVNIRVPVILQTDVTANSANGSNTLNFYGDISGPNNFVKIGNGPVTFRTDMSYTGTTTLREKGTLTLSGSGNLGQGDVIIDNVDARLNFEVSGEATVPNNISGSGAVANSVNTQAPVNLTGILSYTGQTVINARILRFDGVSPALTGGVHVLAAATPDATGAIGGNGSIASAVTVDDKAGLSSRIRDWTGAAGTGYDDLTVQSLAIAGALVVKIDGSGMVNFTESAMSFTILNANTGITGFNPDAVSFVMKNFPGTGTFAVAKSGNSLVLNYTASAPDPFKTFVTGAPYFLTGDDALPNADPDHDGIANSVEFVIGGNPANASDSARLPKLTTSGTDFVITFFRSSGSAYLNPTVQYSSTLSGWTTAVDGTDGITIGTANPTANGLDVVVTIPKAVAVGGKLFARLNVIVP